MITKSVYHTDCHTYLRHCYRTWGVLNLDLYLKKSYSYSRDRHLMNYWSDSCVMKNPHLVHIHPQMQSLFPKGQFSIQRDTRQDKRQSVWRASETNQYIKKVILYCRGRRNRKPNNRVQPLKISKSQLNERFVSHLGVLKDERRLKNKLILFCCFLPSWVPLLF